MKKLVLLLLLVVSHATLLAQSPKVVISDKDGWHKIGETRVDFKKETDKIRVLGANRFSSLKIKIAEAPVYLESFIIYFDKGGKINVAVRQEFSIPGETKEVVLQGEKNIKRVDFTYRTIGNHKDKKAHVELWGFKTNP